MINRAMDFIFTDTLAFAVNATLGTVVRTKLCNYSWEEKIGSVYHLTKDTLDLPTEEIRKLQPRDSSSN